MNGIFRINLFLIIILIEESGTNFIKNIKNFFHNVKENKINIFMMTHKDFNNILSNPAYKIVANSPSNLKNKYNLDVIFCDENS